MVSAIFNIVVGIAMIAAGASGRFSFIGTDSPTVLILVGVAVAGLGVYQAFRARSHD